jgi:hypothetical protein
MPPDVPAGGAGRGAWLDGDLEGAGFHRDLDGLPAWTMPTWIFCPPCRLPVSRQIAAVSSWALIGRPLGKLGQVEEVVARQSNDYGDVIVTGWLGPPEPVRDPLMHPVRFCPQAMRCRPTVERRTTEVTAG